MSYDSYKDSLTRTPVTVVKLTIDQCSRTFGSSPCLATGTKCYKTFATCKYLSAYDRSTVVHTFSTANAPLPFKTGERPYIKSIKYLPTEIKDSLTVSGRVYIEMHDEPDSDVGIDPYYADRTTRPGWFWRKFLARNPNFKGRKIEIYEGFAGLDEGDYELRFSGLIADMKLARGTCTIECEDKLAKLKEIEIPAKVELETHGCTASASIIGIKSGEYSLYPSSGYIRINDEIIAYTGLSNYYSNGVYYFTGCTRGKFGTTAAAANSGDKVTPVEVFLPDHPFDHLATLIKWSKMGNASGYADSDIDLDAFAAYDRTQAPLGDGTPNYNGWRDWPKDDMLGPAGDPGGFSAVIWEPVKLHKLMQEIAEIIDARIWVNEDSKITIRRNVPNKPGRAYHTITEEANISEGSQSVDLNDAGRVTRCTVYWGQYALQNDGEVNSYRFKDTAIDADAESAAGFGAQSAKVIFCRWINVGQSADSWLIGCAPTGPPYETESMKIYYLTKYIKQYVTRLINRFREAPVKLELTVERKDEDILTGDYVKVTTGALQQKDGNDYTAWPFQVVRREPTGNKVKLKLQKVPARKIGLIGPNTMADWTSATDADKEYGYIGDQSNLMSDGTDGYRIF